MKIIKANEFKRKPPIMMIYGQEGIGKTTFAATMPNPIFIKTEEGFPAGVTCDSFDLCKKFNDVVDAFKCLAEEEHEYKTVVLDYLDGVEYILHREMLESSGADSMETACGGFGKAYSIARNKLVNKLLPYVVELRDKKNMWVVLLAHTSVKKIVDPIDGEYQVFAPSFNHAGWDEMFRNSCDCIFFATGKFKNTSIGNANSRVFKCQPTKYYIAKNRYSDDAEIPMNFQSVVESFKTRK